MKKGEYNSNTRGFTIIEVALVIAIAGLIFLMVFVALPGLRASQRDAERREDVVMFLENVKKYQTNNRGALPGLSDNSNEFDEGNTIISVSMDNAKAATNKDDAKWAGFYKKYLGENFMDPNGEYYQLAVMNCSATVPDANCADVDSPSGRALREIANVYFPNDYKMYVVTQATCLGDQAIKSSNPRKLAVIYKLEGAGVYCSNT